MIYDSNNFAVSIPKEHYEIPFLTHADAELSSKLNEMSLVSNSGVRFMFDYKYNPLVTLKDNGILCSVYVVDANIFKSICAGIIGYEKATNLFGITSQTEIHKYDCGSMFSINVKFYMINEKTFDVSYFKNSWKPYHKCSFSIINNLIYNGDFYDADAIRPSHKHDHHDHHHEEKHCDEKRDRENQLKIELKHLLDRNETILSAFTKSSNIVTSLIDYVQVYKTALEDMGFQINSASTINAIRPERRYPNGIRGDVSTAYTSNIRPIDNMCGWVLPWDSDSTQLYNTSKMISLQMNRTVTVPSKEFDEIVKIYNDAMSIKDDVTKTLEDIKENFADIIKEINDNHHCCCHNHRPTPKPPRPEKPSTIDKISVTDPHGMHLYLIYMQRTPEMGSEGDGGFEFYDICSGHTPDEAMMEYQKRMYNKYGEGYELTDLHAVSADRLTWRDYFNFYMIPLPIYTYGYISKLILGFDETNWTPNEDDKIIY